VRRVDAGDGEHRLVLSLAEHVADELVIAAGHDVDVLADLSLRSEDHMQCSGEDHRQQQGEERRSFHTELHRARVKCERQITRAAFVSHLGGPEVEALSN